MVTGGCAGRSEAPYLLEILGICGECFQSLAHRLTARTQRWPARQINIAARTLGASGIPGVRKSGLSSHVLV